MKQILKRLFIVAFIIISATSTAKTKSSIFDVPYKNAVKITFLSWTSGKR